MMTNRPIYRFHQFPAPSPFKFVPVSSTQLSVVVVELLGTRTVPVRSVRSPCLTANSYDCIFAPVCRCAPCNDAAVCRFDEDGAPCHIVLIQRPLLPDSGIVCYINLRITCIVLPSKAKLTAVKRDTSWPLYVEWVNTTVLWLSDIKDTGWTVVIMIV